MRIDVTLPEAAVRGQHGVYVCFDSDGEVLYIGRTMDLFQRVLQHRSTAAWFKQMRSIEFTPCDGPNEARHVEKSMIETFHPAANINDFRPQQTSTRQRLPEWTVAKLVAMHEACVESHWQASENERLNNYIRALRDAGWTLAAIAEGLRMTREGVRLRSLAAVKADASPGVPSLPVKPKPTKKVKPSIPADVLARLLELKAEATQVRGWTPLDSPLRIASERYSELMAEQHLAGVSIYRIAKQLGVTHLAVRARLARHGYMEEVKGLDQAPYLERRWLGPGGFKSGTCKRGHDVTDPTNVRHINGDAKRPICKACERLRTDAYRERNVRTSTDPARVWAIAEGLPVPARGRLPQHIRDQYEAARAAA